MNFEEIMKANRRAIEESFAIPEELLGRHMSYALQVVRREDIIVGWLEMMAETEAPTVPAEAPVVEEPKEKPSALDEAKEQAEPKDKNGGVKPPEEGKCRECNQWRRLNRLKLCYPCWVILCIKDEEKKAGREWKVGDPHPKWCSCEGLGEHKNADGSARGFN